MPKFIIPALLLLGLGLLCGLFLHPVIFSNDSGEAVPAQMVGGNESASLHQRLRDADADLARATVEISRLRNELQQLRQRDSMRNAAVEEPGEGENAVEQVAGSAEGGRWGATQFASRRTASLGSRLGWDEETTERFSKVMALEMEWRRAQRRNDPDAEPYDLYAAAAEILSEEQFEQWLEYQQSEILVQAETFANVELARMGLRLDLNAAQKDAVFPILYEQSLDRQQRDLPNPLFEVPSNDEERMAQLSVILTPEQLEVYLNEMQRRGRRGG
jgi:hypothetical protein